jgi:dihydrofolate synthase/folylpolyglutamate synthase
MRFLMSRLHEPQRQFPVLLVAGTKGKGSTAAMCHNILRTAGYRTGLFSSPHLHTFRERIRIDDELITQEAIVDLINEFAPLFEEIDGLIPFEIITTLAFVTFARAPVDIAVVEVGIGGRLDSTNVTEPLVSVITSISYDHTHILGKTLTHIAREKAGIIRPDGLVVSAPQSPEPMTIIEEVCQEKKAPLIVAGEEKPWRVGRSSLTRQVIYRDDETYELPLLGKHQAANAATAVAAIEALQTKSTFVVPPAALKAGLATVRWPGRLEILNRSPFLVVDSAMNGDSAYQLRQALDDYFPGRPLILIFGSSQDHDYEAMLRTLLPIARTAVVTRSGHMKAAAPEILAAVAGRLGREVLLSQTIAEALALALDQADETDLICVAGSLFCAAEARLAWFERTGLPRPEVDPV